MNSKGIRSNTVENALNNDVFSGSKRMAGKKTFNWSTNAFVLEGSAVIALLS